MLRLALLGCALTLCAGSVQAADPSGAYGYRRRTILPPEVAYRDPTYIPAPPLRIAIPPQSSNVPLYNVPPSRFPRF